MSKLEAEAPQCDGTALNGRWRLVYASEAVYRSSPFFWAFRQASAQLSTPVGVPSGGVRAGDPFAAAVFAITDALPFYDVGAVTQIFSNVCSEETGCLLDEPSSPSTSDGSLGDEPSDGTSDARLASPTAATFESRVELSIGRLFGLRASSSVMTTRASVPSAARSVSRGVLECTLQVETTSAAQSSVAQLLPAAQRLLDDFPSGVALEMAANGAASVTLRTTYLSPRMRVSRPVVELNGVKEDSAMFVFVREELEEVAEAIAESPAVREQ